MKTNKIMKAVKKGIVFTLLIATLVGVFTPAKKAEAASGAKTVTHSYKPMKSESLFRFLDIWGKDTFKVTYNKSTGKITGVKASQSNQTLGTNMVEKGGIKLIKKTDKKWTYEATWYLNFTILPKAFRALAVKFTPGLAALSDLGRICKVTVRYTVTPSSLSHSLSYKFMVPSKLEKAARTIGKLLTQAF